MRVYPNSSSTTFQSIGTSVHLALPTWVPCRRQDPTTVLSVKQVEHCSAGIHLLIGNLEISRFPWEMEELFSNALSSAWRSSNPHLQRALSTPKYICSKEFSSFFLFRLQNWTVRNPDSLPQRQWLFRASKWGWADPNSRYSLKHYLMQNASASSLLVICLMEFLFQGWDLDEQITSFHIPNGLNLRDMHWHHQNVHSSRQVWKMTTSALGTPEQLWGSSLQVQTSAVLANSWTGTFWNTSCYFR